MRITPLVIAACLIPAGAGADELERTFDLDRLAAGITRVVLEVGVGDVEIIADQSEKITAHVEVEAGKGWRGSARARRELDALRLDAVVKGRELHLRIERGDNGDDDHHFGEDWTVHLPPHVELEVELGVGDLRILDVAAAIEAEVGVGDVRIEGEYAWFGRISGECGVGDVSLRTPKGREEGSGFIAHTLSSDGPGNASISVEAGVGDVEIRLR